MIQTFANLPEHIEQAIATILNNQETNEWVTRANALHERYQTRTKNRNNTYFYDASDTLAYLGLRTPATYAQIYSALANLHDLIPTWKPKTILDIGSGPGTAIWAAHALWPEITTAQAIEHNENLLSLGKQIIKSAELPIDVSWEQQEIQGGIEGDRTQYDLVVIANVLNELKPTEAEKLIGQALNKASGMLVIIEPGTPFGSSLVENAAQKLSKAGTILAPYLANSFVPTGDYFLHFPQRFIRPDFQRRIRQNMRDSSTMASDWEEAKYSYVIISKIPAEKSIWGRVVGPIQTQKGFLEIPILTKDGIEKIKVMKRYKEQYSLAKDLKWGEIVAEKEQIVVAK
jgi:ribosomal protein RSM22 (predicted rRNA methylase)